MRIGIDMLADQSAGRLRGTGRYTRGLVGELLAAARHEVVLYYYDRLPGSELLINTNRPAVVDESSGGRGRSWPSKAGHTQIALPGSDAPDVAPPGHRRGTALRPNGSHGAALPQPPHPKANLRLLPRDESLHTAVRRLVHENPDGLDLLLLTCPLENFEGYLPPFPTRRGPRLAAIVYDLIPLRFPEAYLAHPGIAASYRSALAALEQYDLLLTISESARRDIAELLPSCTASVANIKAASELGLFQPSAVRPDEADVCWLQAQGIHKPFLYAIAAPDFRKNLAGLLAAWRCLPGRLRDRFQCVITCAGFVGRPGKPPFAIDGPEGRPTIDLSDQPRDGIVFTDRLDDNRLRLLYQQATGFVFPSRYEGFGLPLLEALQCGAAVIAGNNSSQIEVVGEAGLLADVDDPVKFAAQIARLLDEPGLAQELRSRAVQQAQRFGWPEVARRCLAALEDVHTAPRKTHWLGVWAARGRLAMQERWPCGKFLRRAG